MKPEQQHLLDMAAKILRQEPVGSVPSPCISVCQMDQDSGLCQGCWRSLDEIAAWGAGGIAFRRQVWQRIEARLAQLVP